MCDCHSCRTGRCGCRECDNRPRPFTDAERREMMIRQIKREAAIERIKINELRSPLIDRQQVRRWGEIQKPTGKKDRQN